MQQDESLFGYRSHIKRGWLWSGLAAAAALIGLVVGAPAVALADGGSVRYSYEKVEIGSTVEWVLVPHADDAMAGAVNVAAVERAFDRLRRSKRTTYGNSSIQVSGRVPENARVVVTIDPEYARYALIIIAETVYTLTEMGIPEVSFPGHSTRGLARKDVAFAAYTLTLPLWKALPPGKLTHAQVLMPDGSLVEVSKIYARWASEQDEMRTMVYSYLESDDVFTVVSVTRLLAGLGQFRIPSVIPLLAHPARQVRQEALKVLEDHRGNPEVLSAVLKAMEAEENDALARTFSEYLGKAASSEFNVQREFFLLARGSEEETAAAATALGKRRGDPRVLERLAQALESANAPTALAASQALKELEADEVRIAALASEKVSKEVRLKLAEDLALPTQDPTSRIAGLTHIIKHTLGNSSVQAIYEIGKIETEAARLVVESKLMSSERSRRMAAVDVLVGLGKAESLPALAGAIRADKDPEVLEEAGYKIMVMQSLDAVLQQTKSSDAIVQRIAYRAVGERAVKEGAGAQVFDTLEAGTKHRDAAIRGASARALGVFADARSLKVLEGLVGDKSADVRRDVALGLGNYRDGELVDVLTKYLDDDAPQVVAGAIDAMEQRSEAHAWNRIWSLAEAKDGGVRASALRALVTLVVRDDPEAVGQLIGRLSGAITDRDQRVQIAALEQLGRFNEEMAVTSIALRVSAEEKPLRLAAIVALGETGHRSATSLVVRALDDLDYEVRREAIKALGKLNDRAAKAGLEGRIDKEEEADLVELIRTTLGQMS